MKLSNILEKISSFHLENFDLYAAIQSAKQNPHDKKNQEFQTWFEIDNEGLKTDETIPNDQDEFFPPEWNYRCIKFFYRHRNFYLDEPFRTVFNTINKELEDISEIEYIHIHSMFNFMINPHTDGNLVLIKNLICPDTDDINQFGFNIAKDEFIPTIEKEIWLDTNLIHSAWNHTNQEWKFLTISINKN